MPRSTHQSHRRVFRQEIFQDADKFFVPKSTHDFDVASFALCANKFCSRLLVAAGCGKFYDAISKRQDHRYNFPIQWGQSNSVPIILNGFLSLHGLGALSDPPDIFVTGAFFTSGSDGNPNVIGRPQCGHPAKRYGPLSQKALGEEKVTVVVYSSGSDRSFVSGAQIKAIGPSKKIKDNIVAALRNGSSTPF